MTVKYTDTQKEEIIVQLIADGHKARLSTTGWLLVSGRRTDWREGWNLAFLGTPIGKTPKIRKVV